MNNPKSYPKYSAGRQLVTGVPTVKENSKIDEVFKTITQNISDYTSISYIYIINDYKKLIGITTIKNLLKARESQPQEPIGTIMDTDIISVRPHSHQEKAAQLALINNIKAIPVTTGEGVFLGTVTSDTILKIMHEEKVEDLLKFTGFSRKMTQLDNVMTLPFIESLKHRLPWLLGGLLGGILIAQTISYFETTLQQNIIIAAFIPMMVYMSNAVGQQITAFLIRDSAINEHIPYAKYFLKQFSLVLLISLILGSILYIYSYFAHNQTNVSRVLGLAMFSTVMSSIFTGFLVPFTLIKFKTDPANASGPVGTVVQDFLSVLIYFFIANALL